MVQLKFQNKTESWSEEKESFGGLTIARARAEETLTGDIEGKGVGWYVMTYHGAKDAVPESPFGEDGRRASFDGEMVVDGTIKGKKGTFVLRASGMYFGDLENKWTIVEGSATGELAGIKGSGSSFVKHGNCAPAEGELNLICE